MAKKRYYPKKEQEIKGTPYDSLLEKRLHETVLKDAKFHCKEELVSYSVPHTYEPDFVVEKDGKKFLVETKGRFRDSAEARKYLFIRDSLGENAELVFIMMKQNTPFPFAKKRKDGTKMTHEEWLEKSAIRHWFSDTFSVENL